MCDLFAVKSILFGLAAGDALGVPVEFKRRMMLKQNPVLNMTGYGTHNQPPGTWSDDSSLAFCLAEALTHDFNLYAIAQNFVNWYYTNYWTPYGRVFDVGISTRQAIYHLSTGTRPDLAGGCDEEENGNGSLMRILPLLFYIKDKEISERYQVTRQVSSMTHAHIRSVIACFYYLEFARCLLFCKDKFAAYAQVQQDLSAYLVSMSVSSGEIAVFNRLLKGNIRDLPEEQISSSGYVVHTLEAGIWCLMNTVSYKDAVLAAVNLGEDTDTTGAVTGGLAGILYGYDAIPSEWVAQLARLKDIEDLVSRLTVRMYEVWVILYFARHDHS